MGEARATTRNMIEPPPIAEPVERAMAALAEMVPVLRRSDEPATVAYVEVFRSHSDGSAGSSSWTSPALSDELLAIVGALNVGDVAVVVVRGGGGGSLVEHVDVPW